MRFMVMVRATPNSEAGVMPSEGMLAAMLRFNQELVDAGIMLSGEGLQPSAKGAGWSSRMASASSSTARLPRRRS
jgi:hypothetical protein